MSKQNYLIVGLGLTGLSCARFLKHHDMPFSLYDTRADLNVEQYQQEFATHDLLLQDWSSLDLTQFTHILLSPGVSPNIDLVQQAIELGIKVWGDIELFAHHVKAPVVGVTGTNGKSTVVTLLGEIAKQAGLNVAVAGNIGTPVLDLLRSDRSYDLWVLELSSFQLETIGSLSLQASIILNISDDHLDRYADLNEYAKAKQRIHRHSACVIVNRDDELTNIPEDKRQENQQILSIGIETPENATQWGLRKKEGACWIARGNDCFLPIDVVRIKGQHNYYNIMAAIAMATCYGIARDAIIEAVKQFTGLPHRCQWLRKLDGVDWINDSKGTNIGATVSAITGIGESMQGKIVLIAGGQGKGADFDQLMPVGEHLRKVVVIGEDAHLIEKSLQDSVDVIHANDMDNAVQVAKESARPGDVVLLSPACASFDMFNSFSHRGDVFTKSVMSL